MTKPSRMLCVLLDVFRSFRKTSFIFEMLLVLNGVFYCNNSTFSLEFFLLHFEKIFTVQSKNLVNIYLPHHFFQLFMVIVCTVIIDIFKKKIINRQFFLSTSEVFYKYFWGGSDVQKSAWIFQCVQKKHYLPICKLAKCNVIYIRFFLFLSPLRIDL